MQHDILSPQYLKRLVLRALVNLYERIEPLGENYYQLSKRGQSTKGLFFPGDQEKDFGSMLYHEIVSCDPRLLMPQGVGTPIIHAEVGYNWAIPGHPSEKVDLAFIYPDQFSWKKGHDACENVRIIGAIELKRNLEQPLEDYQADINALCKLAEYASSANHQRRFFGIIAAAYLWPDTIRERKSQLDKLEKLCCEIDERRKKKHDLTLVTMNYVDGRVIKHPWWPSDTKKFASARKRKHFTNARELCNVATLLPVYREISDYIRALPSTIDMQANDGTRWFRAKRRFAAIWPNDNSRTIDVRVLRTRSSWKTYHILENFDDLRNPIKTAHLKGS